MASVICASCGAKTKAGRPKCPRCGEPLVAAAPQAAPPSPRKILAQLKQWRGPLVISGSALSLIILVLVIASQQPELTQVPASAPPATRPASTAPAPSAVPLAVAEPVTSLDFTREGVASYQQGDFNSALQKFEAAIKKNPDDPGALNDLAQVLVRLGRVQEALPHYERAIQLTPSAWGPQFNLANAYGAMGNWTRAIVEFQRADRLFPDDYVTTYNLGMAYHKAGEEEQAINAFQKAIELRPEEPTFHLSLGISYEKLNRREDAARAYETYLEMAPGAAEAANIRSHIETLRKPAQS